MDGKILKKVEQYIALVYSEESELNRIQSLEEKKTVACKKVGLDIKDDFTKSLMLMKDEDCNNLIYDHLRNTQSNEFFNLISDQQLLWEIMQKKMKPLNDDDKEDDDKVLKNYNTKIQLSANSEILLARVNAGYLKIFKGVKEIDVAKKKIVHWNTLEKRVRNREATT